MIRDRKTYDSCSDLPLYNFIKIVVFGNLDYLYFEKKTIFNRNIDLQGKEKSILDEYSVLSGNKSNTGFLSIVKQLTVVSNKLFLVQTIIAYLRTSYTLELTTILKDMGFRYKFTEESLEVDLIATENSAKKLIIRQKELDNEFKASTEKKGNTQEVTEKDWMAMVTQMSKYMGFHIDTKKTCVAQFVTYIDSFIKENTKENGKQAKHR